MFLFLRVQEWKIEVEKLLVLTSRIWKTKKLFALRRRKSRTRSFLRRNIIIFEEPRPIEEPPPVFDIWQRRKKKPSLFDVRPDGGRIPPIFDIRLELQESPIFDLRILRMMKYPPIFNLRTTEDSLEDRYKPCITHSSTNTQRKPEHFHGRGETERGATGLSKAEER